MDEVSSLVTSGTSGGGGSTNWTTKNIQALVSKQAAEIDAQENDDSEISTCAADAANAFVVANRRKTVVDANQDHKNISLQSVRSVAQTVTDPEFTASQQQEMAELLGAWEEPQTAEQKEVSALSILSVAG
jgi:N-formylglutamate amidohydrolase